MKTLLIGQSIRKFGTMSPRTRNPQLAWIGGGRGGSEERGYPFVDVYGEEVDCFVYGTTDEVVLEHGANRRDIRSRVTHGDISTPLGLHVRF